MRVLIGGNIYGCGNIGDDAVLQGILKIVTTAFPTCELAVETEGSRRLDFLPPAVRLVDSYDLKDVTQSIQACDCFISGGGTMIGDELGVNFPLTHNLERIVRSKRHGKAVVMLAIGANRLRTPEGANTARILVGLADAMTLRDRQSRAVCDELGAKPDRTFVTADPAFLLKGEETMRTRELKRRLRSKGKVIGVNVINEAWANQTEFKAAIAEACDELYTRRGYTPVFFANEVRLERFYDYQANQETARMLHCPYEILDPVYYTPGEMIDLVSSFDAVITMRMHGLIFGAIAGTPFATISRVDKVDNFMGSFGMTASGTVKSCQPARIVADVERIIDHWQEIKPHVKAKVKQLRSDCMKNVEILQQVVNDPRSFRRRVSLASLPYLSLERTQGALERSLMAILTGKRTIRQFAAKIKRRWHHD
jgi:polysaccharide pyruvyl transferase WcaK-like protein